MNPTEAGKFLKCICLLRNIIIDREGAPTQFVASFLYQPTHRQSENRFASVGEDRGVNERLLTDVNTQSTLFGRTGLDNPIPMRLGRLSAVFGRLRPSRPCVTTDARQCLRLLSDR
ncbi:hypothetical protein PR048_017174 [Dryococelus australis]|uniref:Uncharacterized protein n=1 Tax=Dryococelus australis TaxID=614101 RepID=A0ABQ9H8T1_9NEOP|nr:hypothetical protein PR048_017174 [Dryococelus australis]